MCSLVQLLKLKRPQVCSGLLSVIIKGGGVSQWQRRPSLSLAYTSESDLPHPSPMFPVVPVLLSVDKKLFPAEASPLLVCFPSCYHAPRFI